MDQYLSNNPKTPLGSTEAMELQHNGAKLTESQDIRLQRPQSTGAIPRSRRPLTESYIAGIAGNNLIAQNAAFPSPINVRADGQNGPFIPPSISDGQEGPFTLHPQTDVSNGPIPKTHGYPRPLVHPTPTADANSPLDFFKTPLDQGPRGFQEHNPPPYRPISLSDTDVHFGKRTQDTGFHSAATIPLADYRPNKRDNYKWLQTPLTHKEEPPPYKLQYRQEPTHSPSHSPSHSDTPVPTTQSLLQASLTPLPPRDANPNPNKRLRASDDDPFEDFTHTSDHGQIHPPGLIHPTGQIHPPGQLHPPIPSPFHGLSHPSLPSPSQGLCPPSIHGNPLDLANRVNWHPVPPTVDTQSTFCPPKVGQSVSLPAFPTACNTFPSPPPKPMYTQTVPSLPPNGQGNRFQTVESPFSFSPMGTGTHSRMGGGGFPSQRHWKSKFSGVGKTSLKLYLRQFSMVSDCNAWTEAEKALQLVSSLEGVALDALDRVQGALTYSGVVDALNLSFPDYDCASSFQNAFDTASRKHGEQAGTFATRLGDLAFKAYPDVPPGSLASLVLSRFLNAQPADLKDKIALVNPTHIRDAVQLINRLDRVEMDRMSAASTTATPRQPKPSVQTLAAAFQDMFLDEDSADTDSYPDITEDPAELIAALSQIGATDIAEVLAANLAKTNPSDNFKCFYWKDTGHTWLRCTKLWDHLKKNGFQAKPRVKPYQRFNPHSASKGTQQASAPTGPPNPLTHPN